MQHSAIKCFTRSLLAVVAMVSLSACVSMDAHREATPDPNKRLDKMLALYEQGRESGSACAELWKAYSATTDCERILNEVERLSVEFPRNTRILLASAVMQYEAGREDKAQLMLDNLLSMPGSHPEAALLRSKIAMNDGSTTRARAVLEAQILLNPDYAELREALAATYYLDGKYDQAQRALSIAGRLGAPGWRLSYHQGLIREAKEDWTAACGLYAMALEQRPDFRAAAARLVGLSHYEDCRRLADRRR
ncbi:tetratricopeptide repeat protein [Spongiibacter sp.]|uniref:tetratricopeptide repeat protein n=1 Tax=Spongiibacter sp. TaxID=2024860 RepID=UPI0035686264